MNTLLGLATALVLATLSHAQVVFSTLAPGDQFSHNVGYFTGVGFSSQADLGFAFTPSASGELTLLRTALYQSSVNRGLNLSIYRDDGTTPGVLLGTWTRTPPRVDSVGVPANTPLWSVPLSGVTVEAGQQYFLAVRAASVFTVWNWYSMTPLTDGTQIFRDPPQVPNWIRDTQGMTAFELSIPSPGSLIPGALALAWFRRRRPESC